LRQGAPDGVRGRIEPPPRSLHGGSDRVSSVLDGPAAAALGPELVEARIRQSPSWLADRRRAAWDAFAALPMPSSTRDEDWRRTDIAKLHLEGFQPLDAIAGGFADTMRAQRDRVAPGAVFAPGAPPTPGPVEGADQLRAQGILIETLEDAAAHQPELVQRALR